MASGGISRLIPNANKCKDRKKREHLVLFTCTSAQRKYDLQCDARAFWYLSKKPHTHCFRLMSERKMIALAGNRHRGMAMAPGLKVWRKPALGVSHVIMVMLREKKKFNISLTNQLRRCFFHGCLKSTVFVAMEWVVHHRVWDFNKQNFHIARTLLATVFVGTRSPKVWFFYDGIKDKRSVLVSKTVILNTHALNTKLKTNLKAIITLHPSRSIEEDSSVLCHPVGLMNFKPCPRH